jgi:integrase
MARHTCGTWLVSLRTPLIAVRDVMGHSSITMTEKYAKLIPTALEDQLAGFSQT